MKDVRPYTRTARPVRYYYTDFGLSRRYDSNDTNPSEVPILGGDKTVPEFQEDPYTPRNPFHTDVYYLGNLIRCDFLQVQSQPASHFRNVLMFSRCRRTQTSRSWNL